MVVLPKAPDKHEPPVLMLVPVSDYKAFIGNYADAATEGNITSFKCPMEPEKTMYAAQWGNYAAVSEDKDVAALMVINVDRIIVTTFAVGGLLAGAAGVLYALVFNEVDWFMGFLPGIKAFTAAVLGGLGNIAGAMVGGLTLGVLESVGPFLLLGGANVPSP